MDNPSHTGILQDVQNVLNEHGVSLASFVIDALRDRRLLFAKDLTARIVDILDALHPHLDEESITEFGRFFASVASSELSELGRSDLWRLPASKLSAGRLQDFSMKKMSQEISSVAPGLSSFLDSICASKKTASEAATDDDETDLAPDQLLQIVRLRAYHICLTNTKSRKRRQSRTLSSTPATETATRFRSQSVSICTRRTRRTR